MEKLLDEIVELCKHLGYSIITAILILVIGFKVVNFIVSLIKKGKVFNKLEKTASGFVLSFVSVLLKIVVVISAATTLGVPMTSVVTILGSVGLAIGLALQGGLSNLAGGLMILIFKPFKVGDFVETNSNSGTVFNISMFYTTLITIDNKKVVIPNGTLTNNTVINYSSMKERMVKLDVSVSYNSDIDKVKNVLLEIAKNNKYVLKNKDVLIGLDKHNDSSLDFTFRPWVKSEDYWACYYELKEQIKKSFDKNDIEIPYPQVDVHISK